MVRVFKKINRLLSRGFLLRLAVILGGLLFVNCAMATAGSQLTLSNIQSTVKAGIGNLSEIMEDIALVAGIGFVFASFFKFHQHKMNPTQVPMSQGVTLLVIGAGLTVFPHLLSTASEGVFGQAVTKLGSTAIKGYIGASGT